MELPQVADSGDGLQKWKAAYIYIYIYVYIYIINKKTELLTRGGPPAWV
jgi:hypothetical protein